MSAYLQRIPLLAPATDKYRSSTLRSSIRTSPSTSTRLNSTKAFRVVNRFCVVWKTPPGSVLSSAPRTCNRSRLMDDPRGYCESMFGLVIVLLPYAPTIIGASDSSHESKSSRYAQLGSMTGTMRLVESVHREPALLGIRRQASQSSGSESEHLLSINPGLNLPHNLTVAHVSPLSFMQ